MKMTISRTIPRRRLVLAAAFAISGCLVGPDYHQPGLPVPAEFGEQSKAAATEVDLSLWWHTLNDPVLNGLVDEALVSNLDLKLASARVREARGLLVASRADLVPQGNISALYERARSSNNVRSSGSDDSGSGGNGGSSSGPYDLYETGFDARWEIDIFGGTRRGIEAAQGAYEAEIESRRDTLVTLLAEVARSYIRLRGAQRELLITEDNVRAQSETVELQRLRLAAGITSDLTVAQSEAQLQATRSRIPPLQAATRQSIHRLSVLLGKEPLALESRLTADAAAIPQGPAVIAAGLPSELLRRRPDVRRAERELAAATANIGAAVADLYPRFEITGSYGFESRRSGNFINNDSKFWSIGPNINWAILNWYAILANIDIQNARQEQALISFKRTVLTSLEEVESALVAYTREQERQKLLEATVIAERRALKLATELHTAGVVDFLNVLNAQLAVFVAEDTLVQSEQAVAHNLVALYKALGGGWEKTDHEAPPTTVETVTEAAGRAESAPTGTGT